MDMTSLTPPGASIASEVGYRFIPAPRTKSTFDAVLDVMSGIAGNIAKTAGLGVGGDYQGLITVQLEAQKQMMLVSMISNVEKSKHETQMAPVRNIRVG